MEKKKSKCDCVFCEDELKNSCFEPSFCMPCEVIFVKCPECGKKYSEKIDKCPACSKKKK